MNALLIAVIGILIYIIGYRFYGTKLARLFDVNPSNKTPAHTHFDGRDYVPAHHWIVLFGHHFASIAGAGPIIGPVIAGMLWGFGPAFLWIVLGSVLIGGVHDFSALMVSIRHAGKSIADISATVISKRAKVIFATFVWFALVLVIAVFAAAASKTFVTTPQVVIPTFGLVFVAILIGVLIYRLKLNLILSTIIGILLLFGLIVLGYRFPIHASFKFWLFILLGYAFIASILPVNLLLQPRDYLAVFVLFFGLFFGYIGLIITHPTIHTPFFIKFSTTQGALVPMLFVIVACGAISGFHSLVASGTTSKQLPSEPHALRIGYGGMLLEGVLAILALVSVTAGLYWYGGKPGFVYPELMKGGNWIKTFGTGYGELTKPLFGGFGLLIGITMLKTFIMTTLDSATRITRYIGEELFGESLGLRFMKNPFLNTVVVIGFATFLALGSWQAIWPIFGASNQLVAALALFVVTTYILGLKKPVWYTLLPGIFMLFITLYALVIKTHEFFIKNNLLLAIIGCALIVLAIFMLIDTLKRWQELSNSTVFRN